MSSLQYVLVNLWVAVIYGACLVSVSIAEPDCTAVQTQCKSPEAGGALSDECIALRQRCDPYFSLTPNLAIPGKESLAYIAPEIPKMVSPDPYASDAYAPYQHYRSYGYWGGQYAGSRLLYPPPAGGWLAGAYRGAYGYPNSQDQWHDPVVSPGSPMYWLMEPGRSGFSETPPEEDFLFFWRSGQYYPYGGGGHRPGFRDGWRHPEAYGD